MRIAGIVVIAALMTVGLAVESVAQRQPSGAPKVDLGAPSNRGIVGRDVPWSGPPTTKFDQYRRNRRMYFEPNRQPFQGSYSRRWQQKLDEIWGRTPSGRNVPRMDRRFDFPRGPREQIFFHPQPWPTVECWGTRCRRIFPPMR